MKQASCLQPRTSHCISPSSLLHGAAGVARHGAQRTSLQGIAAAILGAYAMFLLYLFIARGPLPIGREVLSHVTSGGRRSAASHQVATSLYSLSSHHRLIQPNASSSPHPQATRTLRFSVCNGFANQRLSLAYGFVIAGKTGRAAVVPPLVRDGTQMTTEDVVAQAGSADFEDIYDIDHFIKQLHHSQPSITALRESEGPAPGLYTDLLFSEITSEVVATLQTYSYIDHLRLDCTLFKVWPGQVDPAVEQTYEQDILLRHVNCPPIRTAGVLVCTYINRPDGVRIDKEDERTIWAVLQALQPAAGPARAVASAATALRRISLAMAASEANTHLQPSRAAGAFKPPGQSAGQWNFLHLRMEQDWVNHCATWLAINDGVVRDNCANNTDNIDEMLVTFGFQPRYPLYMATYWNDVDPLREERILSRLRAANYTVVTSREVTPGLAHLSREAAAAVEYQLALKASRFLGNSVSTFGALAMLERRRVGSWAAYYNGGNIPLAQMLPVLHRLPWVFTYNSWSAPYDYMLRAAVRSASKFGGLKPYCLFNGNTSAQIWHWLNEQGVTMISHKPAWAQALSDKARDHLEDNLMHSHLYKRPEMLVATFQRVDVPVVPILDQYTYVLFTDSDVFFRKRIGLESFGSPLPPTLSMSFEFSNEFPYNAGVMLMNLPSLRRSYRGFMSFLLGNTHGMYFPTYGPGDQGALNEYYEAELRSHVLSQAFNAKPYHDFDSNAQIIHFHGPKPHEYLAYLTSGKCDFHWVCEHAWLKSLCKYAIEWKEYVLDEPIAASLADACLYFESPTVSDLYHKKWEGEGGV